MIKSWGQVQLVLQSLLWWQICTHLSSENSGFVSFRNEVHLLIVIMRDDFGDSVNRIVVIIEVQSSQHGSERSSIPWKVNTGKN